MSDLHSKNEKYNRKPKFTDETEQFTFEICDLSIFRQKEPQTFLQKRKPPTKCRIQFRTEFSYIVIYVEKKMVDTSRGKFEVLLLKTRYTMPSIFFQSYLQISILIIFNESNHLPYLEEDLRFIEMIIQFEKIALKGAKS